MAAPAPSARVFVLTSTMDLDIVHEPAFEQGAVARLTRAFPCARSCWSEVPGGMCDRLLTLCSLFQDPHRICSGSVKPGLPPCSLCV